MAEADSQARATPASESEGGWRVVLAGDWRITAERPAWKEVVRAMPTPARVVLAGDEVGAWDSSLALFVREARGWAEGKGITFAAENLPAGVERLIATMDLKRPSGRSDPRWPRDVFSQVGLRSFALMRELRDFSGLVGECIFGVGRFVRGQAQFRWRDCLLEMQQCGAQALPIVSLISFLVGIIMAYQGAVQLRQFGADIYVADLVGLAVVREMGPMMAGIVLAGRTGAAFAATLGNMKANEEIDALKTLGVSPVDFLVMPRMVALFVMMPLLALYSDCLGFLGGLVIGLSILDIPAALYFSETKTIVDLSDISTGLMKAATFGLLIGLAGCLRGLQAERSAAGVGTAATRAVVTGILLIIVSDAIFAVIFNIVGW